MDGHRHSVDIPISKARVALRRVRSLMDPSTNSMTKFFALVDNLIWDTNSSHGISLRFGGGCDRGISALVVSKPFSACGEEEEMDPPQDGCIQHNSKMPHGVNAGLPGMRSELDGNKLHLGRFCSAQEDNGLELVYTQPFNHQWEAQSKYNNPRVVVLIIVQPDERSMYDQHWLSFMLKENDSIADPEPGDQK